MDDKVKLLESSGLFLYGMKIMSEGLQKAAGDRLRNILTAMTTNRVTGVLTGTLITALIQSSSATTVMVVSFVNAGLLNLSQSISVIMGANIGTTVTAWIISLLGFKVDIAMLTLPLLGIGIPLIFSGKSIRKSLGEFIFGFAFLFMGLSFLKDNVPDLTRNPEMLAFIQNYTGMGFLSVILFLLIGTLITVIVQASSATMAVTLIMCSMNWISFELAAALVLGENIGTTITANLAALTANTSARRAALAHLMFNVFGVCWMLVLFYPFTSAISQIVDTYMPSTPDIAVSFKLSAFHTVFNICNVLIMIWFVNFLEKTVCFIIRKKEEEGEFRLCFISGGMLSTAELSILQAHKEISLYAARTLRMLNMVWDLL
ncbi:phosphate:Na+ symporter, partial [termite gut metagenome]